jgi:hypothetical protein
VTDEPQHLVVPPLALMPACPDFLYRSRDIIMTFVEVRPRLQISPNDPDFRVPPGIWSLLFGNPSIGRSLLLRTAKRPLIELEKRADREYQAAMKTWEAEPDGAEPVPISYIVGNMQEILSKHERGVAMLIDEWAAYIGQFDRYAGGGNALVTPGSTSRATTATSTPSPASSGATIS